MALTLTLTLTLTLSYPTLIRSGDEVRVEYTFGYRKNDDGKVRIFLHHSSVPYSAH